MTVLSKAECYEKIRSNISEAAQRAGRNASQITLIAVSKTKPWEDVAEFLKLGQTDFGENYMQEALAKIDAIKNAINLPRPRWHFIGTLQSNKAKLIPQNFVLFHGLNSFSLAQKLQLASEKQETITRCLLEINVDQEASKDGVQPKELFSLLESLSALDRIKIEGLMCIPDPHRVDLKAPFAHLRELMDATNKAGCYKNPLTELSMGMSADYLSAIEEGATMVRLGTILFGERKK